MKFPKFSALIIVNLLLTLTLAGCDVVDSIKDTFNNIFSPETPVEEMSDPERAKKIFELVDANMSSLSSYTTATTMKFEMEIGGNLITVESETISETQNIGFSDFVYHSETTSNARYLDESDYSTFIEGFRDGRMYRSYIGAPASYQIYSFISAADFEAYLIERSNPDEMDFKISDFSVFSSEKTDNGWKLTFSNVTSEAVIEKYSDILGADMLPEGIAFDDLCMEFYISSNYYCTKSVLDVIFSVADDVEESEIPKISAEMTYSKMNATTATALDFYGYSRVQDIRLITKTDRAFDQIADSENGSFILKSYGETTQDQNYQLAETDNMTYSTSNGKLVYVLNAEADGTAASISYSNGIKTITVAGNAATVESDDESEREFINSFAFPVAFEEDNVYSIEKGENENSYVFIMNLSDTAKQKLFGNSASQIKYCKLEMTVNFDGEKVTSYSAHLYYNTNSSGTYYHSRWSVENIVYN